MSNCALNLTLSGKRCTKVQRVLFIELTRLLKCPASLTAMFRNIHSVPGLGMYCKACCRITAALCALAEIGGGEQDGLEG